MHLRGEYKEIVRVFGLVRKAQESGINKYNFKTKKKVPEEYTLGTGHVLFFYNKLNYVLKRYNELTTEMINRGFKPNPVPNEALLENIDSSWINDYSPTPEAISLNRQRIKDRTNPNW